MEVIQAEQITNLNLEKILKIHPSISFCYLTVNNKFLTFTAILYILAAGAYLVSHFWQEINERIVETLC